MPEAAPAVRFRLCSGYWGAHRDSTSGSLLSTPAPAPVLGYTQLVLTEPGCTVSCSSAS